MNQVERRNQIKEALIQIFKICKECPFTKGAPMHAGIVKALPEYHSRIERSVFSHSCHRTDPNADGYDFNYKGMIQHCAGATILCFKDKDCSGQVELILVERAGKLDRSKLNMQAPVFDSFIQMVRYYANMIDPKGIRRKKLGIKVKKPFLQHPQD